MDLNVFLLSGGTRVPVHVGAVTGLLKADFNIRGWAGVSAGSLVASVFASGYSADDAFRLMLETNYRRFLDFNPVTSVRGMGLYAGNKFERWLNSFLKGRRFRDLHVPFSVVATDVATKSPFIFSIDNTPDITLARAVRCSISLPGIFATPQVNGRALIDGCFADVRPHMLFPESSAQSLVVRMCESGPRKPEVSRKLTSKRMLFNIAEMILGNLKGIQNPDFWDQHLRIPIGRSSGLNFSLSDDEKRSLFDRGFASAQSFLMDTILGAVEQESAKPQPLSESSQQTDWKLEESAFERSQKPRLQYECSVP